MEQAEIEKTENQAMVVVARGMGLIVDSPKTYEEAGAVLVSIKDAAKQITAFWDDPIKKARAAWTALTERRGAMIKPLEEAEKHIKGQMAAFHTKLEAEKREKEAALRAKMEAEAKAKAEEIAKENELLGNSQEAAVIRAAPVIAPAVTLAPVVEVEKIKYREDWKAEVTDPAAVPREFLVVDERKLAALARAMKADANVPGVRFYAEKIVVAGR